MSAFLFFRFEQTTQCAEICFNRKEPKKIAVMGIIFEFKRYPDVINDPDSERAIK